MTREEQREKMLEYWRSKPTLEEAFDQIIQLDGLGAFGFWKGHPYAGPDEWACGTLMWEGSFNYYGQGATPLDAAWALVAKLEQARVDRGEIDRKLRLG